MLPWLVKMHGFIQLLSNWIDSYESCWTMLNDAESIWVILCWQGIFEMFQDPGDTCWPWLQYIFYPCLPLRLCEIPHSPGYAGRRWSSGLGLDSFPTQSLCRRYVSFFSFVFGIFVAHRRFCFLHTTVLFWWLAATLRFRGFICFDALLLQAWSRGVCEHGKGQTSVMNTT